MFMVDINGCNNTNHTVTGQMIIRIWSEQFLEKLLRKS